MFGVSGWTFAHFSRLRATVAALAVPIILLGCGGEIAVVSASAPAEEPIRQGASIAKPLMGVAVVGKVYEDSLLVAPNDKRNPIISIALSNPTAGGSAPAIDSTGKVRWTPNDTDLQATSALSLVATLLNGDTLTTPVGVRVRREFVVIDVLLGPDEASYSDPDGRWIVKATRSSIDQSIHGRLEVVEIFDKASLVSWRVTGVDTDRTVRLELLAKPVLPATSEVSPLTLQAEYPLSAVSLTRLEFEEVGLKRLGSMIDRGVDVFSSRKDQDYSLTKGRNAPITVPAREHIVFDYLWSCNGDAAACRLKAESKAPIVLIHGFSGLDNSYSTSLKGGLDGTWGSLAQTLVDKGHPVFEMRWHTYMRFEEAAGALANFSAAVSKYTLRKPIVIAHSFGGVVSHLALQSSGIEFRDGQWRPVPYGNQIAKLVTLNSPVAGINHPDGDSPFDSKKAISGGGIFDMTRGRDHTDSLIGGCYAITCLQAGAFFSTPTIVMDLKANVALLAGDSNVTLLVDSSGFPQSVSTSTTANLVWEGESIKRIQTSMNEEIRNGRPSLPVPVLRFAGFQNLAVEDRNTLLGDGLISLVGMALSPLDFVANPFSADSNFGYRFIDQTKRILYSPASTQQKAFNELVAGDCLRWNPESDRPYVICAMSAHTGINRVRPVDFSIAHLGDAELPIQHPLLTLIDDPDWIASPPLDAPFIEDLLSRAPESIFAWRAFKTENSVQEYLSRLPALVTLKEKSTGRVVLSKVVYGISSTSIYRWNLGRDLTIELRRVPDLSQYKMTLQMGGGLFELFGYASYYQEFNNLSGVQIIDPPIDLSPGALVNVSGRVIDGQTTSTPIDTAVVYLAKGTDRSAEFLRSVPLDATKTTRKVITNSSGQFTVSGLEPGNYSVLVTRAGYTDELQGRVTIAQGTVLSLSLLRVLANGEASVTLRWANASAGPNVVRDLDSHLLRFSANGRIDYHIYYGQRTVTGLLDSLDRDDTDYEGPETITIGLDTTKNYTYFVHQFSSTGTIVQSFPRVYLRLGTRTESFAPPSIQGSPRYWRVFDIVAGQLRPCLVDCLLSSEPTGLMAANKPSQFPALPVEFKQIFEAAKPKQAMPTP
jgi:pimeloyl-ACP methyl ester carboxylesterase